MPRSEYDAVKALHYSSLRWMAVSPRHYAWYSEHRQADTPAFARGRAVHAALLEPDVFDAATPRDLGVSASDYELARDVRGCMRERGEQALRLLDGHTELSVFWSRYKARLDVVSHDGSRVAELKTIRSIESALWSVRKYQYHAQLAWYCDAIGATAASILFVETRPPYDCAVVHVPPSLLEDGRAEYRRWLSRLEECERTGVYPGVGVIDLAGDGEIDMDGIE